MLKGSATSIKLYTNIFINRESKEFLNNWEDLMSRVPRTGTIVVGADVNEHVENNPGVFQRMHDERAMAKGTEKGRQSWKAWRA